MNDQVPDNLAELMEIWDAHHPPKGVERKNSKLVRCAYCGKWIKTGKPYYATMTGPMHQKCLESFDR